MTIDDKHIMREVKASPESGFRLLLSKYKEPIYWHIRRMVGSHSDAQDAAQETFVRVYRNFSKCACAEQMRGWIFRIATNEALRLLGKRKSNAVSLDEEASPNEALYASEYFNQADQLAVLLQKAILSLPTKQQLAFNLRYYDELSYREIAEVIGSSEASAKVSYHIAKEKIVEYINTNDL